MNKIPQRKCIACGTMYDKNTLLRIAYGKDGVIAADISGKMPGRGCYICKNEKCLQLAEKQKKIERAFKCRVPEEIYADIKRICE